MTARTPAVQPDRLLDIPDILDILVVATRFPLASETFVRQQCLDLVRLGHRVEILALSEGNTPWSPEESAAGLPSITRVARIDAPLVRRLAAAPPRALSLLARAPLAAARAATPLGGARAINGQLLAIADALRAPRRYDAIHCHFGAAGRIACSMRDAGLVAGPISVGFYGYDLTREPMQRGRDLYGRLFAAASLLLPHSNYLAERLLELGAPRDRIHLHHLGIDLTRFPEVDRSGRSGPVRALAVGRFVEKKGFEFLLRALVDAPADMTLTLVGDGPLRPRCEELARTLGVGSRVDFTGWLATDGVAAAMAAADLLVVPSVTASDGDMEGLPIVIAEAMATGLAVVGTAHSGIPEIVAHGETGLVVPERDAPALAAALRTCGSREFLLACGARARGKVRREFDGKALAEGLCAHFRSGL